MESAHNSIVETEGATVASRDHLDHESVVRSNELLCQLSDLIDGFSDLSTHFRYSSIASHETNGWTPWDYIESLMAISGSERALRNASISR